MNYRHRHRHRHRHPWDIPHFGKLILVALESTPLPTVKMTSCAKKPLILKRKSVVNHRQLVLRVMDRLIRHTEHLLLTVTGDERKRHQFRVRQFKKALDSINKYPIDKPITSSAELLHLEGVGRGIATRIDEIIRTGSLSELAQEIKGEAKSTIIQQLAGISGIGEVTARKLVDQGVTSLDDLQNKVGQGQITLTHHMVKGLKYHDQIIQKIPREEIDDIRQIVIQSFAHQQSSLKIEICGSYRRGCRVSSDIDVLMTGQIEGGLPRIVAELTRSGLLIDNLTSNGQTKYMGICAHPEVKVGRRIDIRLVEPDSYYPALLYFTGSKALNQRMRQTAIELGLTLNEYGLFRQSEKIRVNSEKDIFDYLGLTYLSPPERDQA